MKWKVSADQLVHFHQRMHLKKKLADQLVGFQKWVRRRAKMELALISLALPLPNVKIWLIFKRRRKEIGTDSVQQRASSLTYYWVCRQIVRKTNRTDFGQTVRRKIVRTDLPWTNRTEDKLYRLLWLGVDKSYRRQIVRTAYPGAAAKPVLLLTLCCC